MFGWGWFEWIFAVVIATIVGLLVFVLILLFLLVEPSKPGSRKEGMGIVRSKSFTPAHMTTSFMWVGKVMIPMAIHHPDSWCLTMEVGGESAEVGISQEFYERVQPGMSFKIIYTRTFFTNRIKIKEIR